MSSTFRPGTAAELTSEVELTLSCRGLQGKDLLSKSDPMCVTYIQAFGESRWVEFHRTEVIENTHEPDFASKVLMSYRFEEQQLLKFEVYDVDSTSSNLEDHDFLGVAACSLGQIISSGKGVESIDHFVLIDLPTLSPEYEEEVFQLAIINQPYGQYWRGCPHHVFRPHDCLAHVEQTGTPYHPQRMHAKGPSDFPVQGGIFTMVQLSLSKRGLDSKHQQGYILIIAEELAALKDEVVMQFSGSNLDKMHFFGKSNPFLVFHKSLESGDYVVVHKTEVMKNTLNPLWQKFSIPVRTLCSGDYDRNIKVACYDWNANGKHSLIGEFFITLRQLSEGHSVFQCIHPEKLKKNSSYTHSGVISRDLFEVHKMYTFMDYIKGGTQLHCSIGIDFTGSNGNPASPQSLHYISNVPNAYEQAIQAVGSIIQDYDSDKLFPVLGFGARLPPDGMVSHEFFVNMNPTNPYCSEISGVLEAYRNCIHQVQLYGPTNFSPIINHVARFASAYRDGSSYFILLILTDGVISDMPQTIQAIVSASVLPMSVIIVGIGSADFSAMEVLDADTVTLKSGGVHAARDIVQFVPFNRFTHEGDHQVARLRLAREVLAEIPTQFCSYMKANNIEPGPPKQNVSVLPPDPNHILTAI